MLESISAGIDVTNYVDFRLVVLVKLINLVTDALFLCLNAKIIKLEYIIFSLNLSAKLVISY